MEDRSSTAGDERTGRDATTTTIVAVPVADLPAGEAVVVETAAAPGPLDAGRERLTQAAGAAGSAVGGAAGAVKETAGSAAGVVKETAAAAADKAAQTGTAISTGVSSAATQAVGATSAAASHLAEGATQAADTVATTARGAGATVSSTVQRGIVSARTFLLARPAVLLGGAFALGIVIGRLV